ncbi:hypothetical protein [Kitasatospora sp. NPDC058478]|uniref:hypothetical protein n=1 Tax=unclassified Kitasatospora TaxID=2633591 RepID=UPI00365A90CC
MLDVDVLVIPGIAEFARGGLPAPARTDDGNPWVDGVCWLYCGQRWTRVLWIGPATVAGMNAPMFACGPCIAELQERVWKSVLLGDEPAEPVPDAVRTGAEPAPAVETDQPRRGRHRRPGLLRRT